MPKVNEKEKLYKYLVEAAESDLVMLDTSENAQEKEDEILEELAISLAIVEECRYAIPSLQHSVPKSVDFLTDILPTLDEARFRQIVRVSWTNFKVIWELIRNDEVFTGQRSVQQFPVEVQLIVVLYRLGCSGEGASVAKIACLFGLGDGGTLQKITNRVFQAIIRLLKQFLYWPDAEERQNMVLQTCHELPHCVGYVDKHFAFHAYPVHGGQLARRLGNFCIVLLGRGFL